MKAGEIFGRRSSTEPVASVSLSGGGGRRASTDSSGSSSARVAPATGNKPRQSLSGALTGDALQDQRDRIIVSVRARPLNSRENEGTCVWNFGDAFLEELKDDGVTTTGAQKHTYDHVFAPNVGTEEVYEKQCKQIVHGAMEGYNGTVFAYGQTSSGKTFTLMGQPGTNPGVCLQAFDDIFNTIRRRGNQEWKVAVSYLEIYNENVTDLLQTDIKTGQNLKIFQDPVYGPRVKGVVEDPVCSPKDCLDVFLRGEKIRRYASTDMNDKSSRSHTIFQMRIEAKALEGAAQAVSSERMRAIAVSFQAAQQSLMADRATLYLVDHAIQELQSQVGDIIISLSMSAGLAGACATTGLPIFIDDVYQDQRFDNANDKKTGFRSKSMCIVPLIFDGTVIAVAQFINKKGGDSFSRVDQQQAESFASKAAPDMAAAQAGVRESSSGLLNLVDLAGSERNKKTGATGNVLKEAGHINKSLMTLGVCIFALSEGKAGHIPFRDSKLTMLLASSLGGNARTAIICAISPATRNRSETISTLQFANRAKLIINKTHQNVRRDNSELLGQYQFQVDKLKVEVKHTNVVHKWQLAALRAALRAKSDELRAECEGKGKPCNEQLLKENEASRKLCEEKDARIRELELQVSALQSRGADSSSNGNCVETRQQNLLGGFDFRTDKNHASIPGRDYLRNGLGQAASQASSSWMPAHALLEKRLAQDRQKLGSITELASSLIRGLEEVHRDLQHGVSSLGSRRGTSGSPTPASPASRVSPAGSQTWGASEHRKMNF